MASQSLDLIHPACTGLFGMGIGLTVGAVGGLFSNSQAIQIVARSILVGVAASTVQVWLILRDSPFHFSLCTKDSPITKDKEAQIVRSSNPVVKIMCQAILTARVHAVFGLMFAGAARVRFSRFSTTIGANQMMRPLVLIHLFALATSHIAAWRCPEDPNDWSDSLRAKAKARQGEYVKTVIESSIAILSIMVAERLGRVKLL